MDRPEDPEEPHAMACPQCGAQAEREATDVGILMKCAACGFEAGDPLLLDFKND